MKFLQAALTMAQTAVYSLHKTSTRDVSSASTLGVDRQQKQPSESNSMLQTAYANSHDLSLRVKHQISLHLGSFVLLVAAHTKKGK